MSAALVIAECETTIAGTAVPPRPAAPAPASGRATRALAVRQSLAKARKNLKRRLSLSAAGPR